MRATLVTLKPVDWFLALSALIINLWLALDVAGYPQRGLPGYAARNKKQRADTARQLEAQARRLQGNHPWAGRYQEFDHLTIAHDLGYRRTPMTGRWSDQGQIQDLGPRLVLRSDSLDDRPEHRQGFLIVTWGPRVYLVRNDEVEKFVAAVNAGDEPRHESYGRFFLREGDALKPAPGWPDLPAAYRRNILAKPIEARISFIGRVAPIPFPSSKTARMVMDAGRDKGVSLGLKFFYPRDMLEGTYLYEAGIVIGTVSEHSSEGLSDFSGLTSPPRVGLPLSTHFEAPKHTLSIGGCGGAWDRDSHYGWQLPGGYSDEKD